MPPSRPYVVGLTGGIASGKSTIARVLSRAGARVIDADQVARQLTAPGGAALPLIREAFGDSVFEGDMLKRKALGARVFADAEALSRLNALMHPLILQDIEHTLDGMEGRGPVVLDAALLYEAGWQGICDEMWCAYAPRFVQLRRVMRRDGLSRGEAIRRVSSQMPGKEKRRLANHVIWTCGPKPCSARRALALWRGALRRAKIA